ncbi:MAG: beta-phosphoglucomutase [Saprospiraceae bacterium]|nr:beta-phosphoglucomutase [Saprospiraceae bacterium]
MIKGYIFDLDGVIVDTAKYHYNAWRRLANTLDFDITEEQNENLKGVSRVESLEYILGIGNLQFSAQKMAEMAEQKNTWYVESISNMDKSELLPGSEELIKEIKNKGLKVSLGSASKNSMRILKATKLIDYFDAVIDGTKTTESKPHPQVFLMGAEALKLKPEECIVFEDSINGIKAANNGGFVSIGVGDQKILHEADIVIPSLEGITIEKLNSLIAQH